MISLSVRCPQKERGLSVVNAGGLQPCDEAPVARLGAANSQINS
jgi:hypothetical protein